LKDGPVLKAGAPLPLLNPEMQAEVGASNWAEFLGFFANFLTDFLRIFTGED
jgi:hypothetical protein